MHDASFVRGREGIGELSKTRMTSGNGQRPRNVASERRPGHELHRE